MTTSAITNDDLLEIMQDLMKMTSEGFESLGNKIGNLEGDVGTLKSDFSILKGDVSILRSDVSTLQGDVAIIRKDLTTLDSKVDRIENEQHAQTNDIGEILDRLVVLEKSAHTHPKHRVM